MPLVAVLIALSLLRPVDHDESQYVAAAVLTAAGRLPYVDYAYLQTPLQPFVFAPLAALAGAWTWPALRIANALLGAVAVAGVHRGARAVGAEARHALAAAFLFATCDVLLFSVGVARNDALPVACFAWAVALIAEDGSERWRSVAVGGLLALAAAAKISYAVPAAAFGAYALLHRERRPLLVAMGALPVLLFVAWSWALSPAGFVFGTLDFPAHAPAQYYAGRPWKMSLAAKGVDTLKFLGMGPGLPALVIVARQFPRRRLDALDVLLVGSLLAALLPSPTWRQYLLPVLPPLFVLLARSWSEAPPSTRQRGTLAAFSFIGIAATSAATAAPGTLHLATALRQAAAAKRVMDAEGVNGPVITLSPQLLPTTGRLPDVRFATGPFYFRSEGLLPPEAERRLHLVGKAGPIGSLGGSDAALIGGESHRASGDERLDADLARAFAGRAIPIPDTGLVLLVHRSATWATRRDGPAVPMGGRSRR